MTVQGMAPTVTAGNARSVLGGSREVGCDVLGACPECPVFKSSASPAPPAVGGFRAWVAGGKTREEGWRSVMRQLTLSDLVYGTVARNSMSI